MIAGLFKPTGGVGRWLCWCMQYKCCNRTTYTSTSSLQHSSVLLTTLILFFCLSLTNIVFPMTPLLPLLSLMFASSAFAKSLASRQTSSACDGLGEFDTASAAFTFSAIKVAADGSHTDDTLIPLIFTWAGEDASDDGLFYLTVRPFMVPRLTIVMISDTLCDRAILDRTITSTAYHSAKASSKRRSLQRIRSPPIRPAAMLSSSGPGPISSPLQSIAVR